MQRHLSRYTAMGYCVRFMEGKEREVLYFFAIIANVLVFLHLLWMCGEEQIRDDFLYNVFREISLIVIFMLCTFVLFTTIR